MTKIIIGKTENGSRILKKHLPCIKEKRHENGNGWHTKKISTMNRKQQNAQKVIRQKC